MGWYIAYEDDEKIVWECDVCLNPSHTKTTYKRG